MDNCRIHSVNELVARVRAFGARVIFLEPYDPQHMPIEVGFRAMKRCARAIVAALLACTARARTHRCARPRPTPSPSLPASPRTVFAHAPLAGGFAKIGTC